MSHPRHPHVPANGETNGREVHRVPHDHHQVYVVRCDQADCLALSDWMDSVLGRDYFFKQRHLSSILERRNNWVWSIVVDEVCSGLVILYDASVLHNLYLSPELRHAGIGTAVLQHFRPKRIRSKTNMLAGDPTEFYLRNGYVVDQPDPTRPHIIDMVLPQGAGETEPPQGVAAPAMNGRHIVDAAAESRCAGEDSGASVAAAQPCAPPANGRAVDVRATGGTSSPVAARVAASTPTDSPALDDSGHVVLTLDQYNALATLKKNRDRIAAYRAKRKAEKSASKTKS